MDNTSVIMKEGLSTTLMANRAVSITALRFLFYFFVKKKKEKNLKRRSISADKMEVKKWRIPAS